MSTQLLLPSRFKRIGWFILIPSLVLGIILISKGYEAEWLNLRVFSLFNDNALFDNGNHRNFSFVETNVTNTIVGMLFLVGALMVSFSKEKREDEFIANLRLSSLLWSVWVNYVLLLVAFLLVYGLAFFSVMVYNMFTILIIFIIRFNYILWRSAKSVVDEK